MKLWYSPTSPFARKVRIAAHELHIDDALELEEVDPWTDARLRQLNPLAKVPTLQLDDGGVLYESSVIISYFDSNVMGGLIPHLGSARWRALRFEALCDGLSTAAGRIFAGERRGDPDPIEDRLVEAVQAGLDAMERERLNHERPTVGEIAAAAALSYIDFRWPDRDWREGRSRAAEFMQAMNERPSMTETAYRLPLANLRAADDGEHAGS
jgi:glutathione S-transferase